MKIFHVSKETVFYHCLFILAYNLIRNNFHIIAQGVFFVTHKRSFKSHLVYARLVRALKFE